MNPDDFSAKAQQLLRELTEHYPDACVQLLVCWTEEDQTKAFKTGIGNWYARQGMAHEFINSEIAEENARQLAEQIKPPDED